jgi:hypothetical protein
VLECLPEKARKGDTTCILYACSVPVLLGILSDSNGYTFVGIFFFLTGVCRKGSVQDEENVECTFCIQ